MTTEQINDWRYPPVPQAVREALKDYPEIIIYIENQLNNDQLSVYPSLELNERVERLEAVEGIFKKAFGHFTGLGRALPNGEQRRHAIVDASNALTWPGYQQLEAFYGFSMADIKKYPPAPKAIQEALKDYPELIAHLEWALRDDDWAMSNTLELYGRTTRLHRITEYLKDALSNMSVKAAAKLKAAQESGDEAAIAAAQAEDDALTVAWWARGKAWDELEDFYGIEMSPEDGKGLRIKEGM